MRYLNGPYSFIIIGSLRGFVFNVFVFFIRSSIQNLTLHYFRCYHFILLLFATFICLKKENYVDSLDIIKSS